MEPLRAETLFRLLTAKITKAAKIYGEPLIATLKERRQNWTTLLPLSPRLELLFGVRTTTHEERFDVMAFWERIDYPIQVHRDRQVPVTLFIKPSAKSSMADSPPHNTMLKQLVSRLTRSNSREIVSLSDLLDAGGVGHERMEVEGGSMGSNEYFRDVMSVLHVDDIDAEGAISFDAKWNLPTEASLNVKEYPQRGEIRAFTLDRNAFRSLLGSAIHTLLHPGNRQLRATYPYADVWRVKGKNLIIETLKTLSPRSCCLVGQGDVSSFTSSFRNLWLVLLNFAALAEELEMNNALPPFVLTWGTTKVVGKLSTILKVFIRLTFRMPVMDEVLHQEFRSIGGMLGVPGINTLACTTFALIQRGLTDSILVNYRLINRAKTYVGGDDFVSLLIGPSRVDLSCAWQTIVSVIKKYVGSLSEENSAFLPTNTTSRGSMFLPFLFCKKLIYAKWSTLGNGVQLKLHSQFTIPLPSLLLSKRINDSRKDQEEWLSYTTTLWSHLPWVQDRDVIQSTILDVFDTVFQTYLPRFRRDSRILRYWGRLNEQRESESAEEVIESFIPFVTHGYHWPTSREDVRRFLVCLGRLLIRYAQFGDEGATIYLTKPDLRFVATTPSAIYPIVSNALPDLTWVSRLTALVLQLRATQASFLLR
jgi:hypothetical protein